MYLGCGVQCVQVHCVLWSVHLLVSMYLGCWVQYEQVHCVLWSVHLLVSMYLGCGVQCVQVHSVLRSVQASSGYSKEHEELSWSSTQIHNQLRFFSLDVSKQHKVV